MRKRILIVTILVILILVPVVGSVVAGVTIYNRLTSVSPNCANRPDDLDNTPDAFDLPNDRDASAYYMPIYETVTFPSREANLTISGWWVPAAAASETAPTVILVHGLNGCRQSPSILLAAGMLHQHGFNALMIDMRDHGASEVEDGRYAAGTEEYLDVLGAWDWLVNEQNIPEERIGLFGTSLGAGTVLIAAGEEPRVAAVWEDSSFADVRVATVAEVERNNYPSWFVPIGLFVGRLMTGDDITSMSPLEAVIKIGMRPLFITHGTGDQRLSLQYAYDLAAAANDLGNPVEPWVIEGSDHVRGIFDQTDEYETRLIAFFTEHLGV